MLSIIIPTLNEEKYLPILLECLKSQTFQDFEIIIADANSTDRTREIALQYGARIVDGGIPAIGRNNGAKIAKKDLLLFIDADITFKPDFLNKIVVNFNKKNLDAANFIYDLERYDKGLKKILRVWNLLSPRLATSRFVIGSSQVLMIKKSVFNQLKGFNKELETSEDQDLIKRVQSKKFKFSYIKEEYYHSTRRTDDNGVLIIFGFYFISTFFLAFKLYRTKFFQKLIDNIYGGWGKW